MYMTIERNFVQVVGVIWMPSTTAAMEYKLSKYDLENIGEFTRENVEKWLDKRAGDFQSITDFYATYKDKEIQWADEENEFIYSDCMFGNEF